MVQVLLQLLVQALWGDAEDELDEQAGEAPDIGFYVAFLAVEQLGGRVWVADWVFYWGQLQHAALVVYFGWVVASGYAVLPEMPPPQIDQTIPMLINQVNLPENPPGKLRNTLPIKTQSTGTMPVLFPPHTIKILRQIHNLIPFQNHLNFEPIITQPHISEADMRPVYRVAIGIDGLELFDVEGLCLVLAGGVEGVEWVGGGGGRWQRDRVKQGEV